MAYVANDFGHWQLMPTNTYTYIHTHTHTYTLMHTHTHAHTYTYTHMHVYQTNKVIGSSGLPATTQTQT